MRRVGVCFLLVLALAAIALAEKTDWTSWLPAKNAVSKDQYGFEHDRTNFSYRWRLSTPCTGKNCSFDLQLRNNSDKRESITYIVEAEDENGSPSSYKEHRNLDPHEVQDVPTGRLQGQRVEQVRIEVS
jgi:hypothetical protein